MTTPDNQPDFYSMSLEELLVLQRAKAKPLPLGELKHLEIFSLQEILDPGFAGVILANLIRNALNEEKHDIARTETAARALMHP